MPMLPTGVVNQEEADSFLMQQLNEGRGGFGDPYGTGQPFNPWRLRERLFQGGEYYALYPGEELFYRNKGARVISGNGEFLVSARDAQRIGEAEGGGGLENLFSMGPVIGAAIVSAGTIGGLFPGTESLSASLAAQGGIFGSAGGAAVNEFGWSLSDYYAAADLADFEAGAALLDGAGVSYEQFLAEVPGVTVEQAAQTVTPEVFRDPWDLLQDPYNTYQTPQVYNAPLPAPPSLPGMPSLQTVSNLASPVLRALSPQQQPAAGPRVSASSPFNLFGGALGGTGSAARPGLFGQPTAGLGAFTPYGARFSPDPLALQRVSDSGAMNWILIGLAAVAAAVLLKA